MVTEGTFCQGGGGGWEGQAGFMSDELSSIQRGEAKPLSACCAGWYITKKAPGRFQYFPQPNRFFVSEEGWLVGHQITLFIL